MGLSYLVLQLLILSSSSYGFILSHSYSPIYNYNRASRAQVSANTALISLQQSHQRTHTSLRNLGGRRQVEHEHANDSILIRRAESSSYLNDNDSCSSATPSDSLHPEHLHGQKNHQRQQVGRSFLRFLASFQYNVKPILLRINTNRTSSSNPSLAESNQQQNHINAIVNILDDFFSNDEIRNIIFIGSNNMNVKQQDTAKKDSVDLYYASRWVEEVAYFKTQNWVNFTADISKNAAIRNTTETKSIPKEATMDHSSQIDCSNGIASEKCGSKSKTKSDILELRIKTNFLVFTIYAVAILGVQVEPSRTIKEWRPRATVEKTTTHENYTAYQPESTLVGVDGAVEVLPPEYQFVLLDQDFEAEGPPPLVWVFNQLTGKTSGEQRDENMKKGEESVAKKRSPHLFHAFLHVRPSICPHMTSRVLDNDEIHNENESEVNVNGMEVKFHASSMAEINISFPSMLLNILPVPKERIERQGNVALSKDMERDVVPGILAFRKAFVEYCKNKTL